jgi:antitoxin component YwqK of YwqJK toxin-antitoxin module
MLGYKAAKHGDIRVLITLVIPDDAKTNLDRKYIAKKETAKYRTNRAMVLKIEDAEGKSYETATTSIYYDKILIYSVGKVVEEPAFDPVLERVCTKGIHFFLDKHVAELYNLDPSNNDWTGVWKEWYDNGQIKVKMTIENGLIVSTVTGWYESGVKEYESIELEGNNRHSIFYYPTGEKETEFIGDMVDRNEIKNCKMYYTNGWFKKDMAKQNKKLHGYYVEWYKNGLKKCEGTYVNGLMEGLYQSWYENGQKHSEVTYANEKMEGLYKIWYQNGQKHSEVTYVNGKMEGLYKIWYQNGHKKEEYTYVNGKREGLYLWYENGHKKEEYTYVNGKIEGLYQTWYENGQKHSEVTYVNGKMEGLYQSWYITGQKCSEIFYKNGLMNGVCQYWYENGQKKEEYTCANGKMEGLYQIWYENGQKKEESTSVNGRMEGLCQKWNEEGLLEFSVLYTNPNYI